MIHCLKKNPRSGFKWLPLLIITALGAMALAGCAGSPDFEGVRSMHVREFSQSLAQKSEELILENRPLDLDACIRIALANNLDIKVANINSRLAKLDRNIAFSYFLPQVDLEVTRLQNDKQQLQKAMGTYLAMADQNITQSVINIQLSVFNPSTWFLYEARKKGEDIQNLVSQRVRQGIRLQVTALYLACLSQEASAKAIESALEQAETMLKEMEALKREGLILESNLKEARVFLVAQQHRLRENRRLTYETKAELMEAMGLSPLVEISLKGAPFLTVNDDEISEQILSALLNRIELKISDREISIRKDAIKMAIADFLPKLVFIGNYTSTSNAYVLYQNLLGYGVSGVLTLFDGFANIQEYKAAKEKRQEAMVKREQTCMKIMLEVIRARNLLDKAKDQRALMSLKLDASETNLEEIQAKWREELVTAAEKLNAVAQYAAAEANLNLANYQYQVGVATLNDVLGFSEKETDREKAD